MAAKFVCFTARASGTPSAVQVDRVYLVQEEGDYVAIWFDEGDNHDYIQVSEPFAIVVARLNGEDQSDGR